MVSVMRYDPSALCIFLYPPEGAAIESSRLSSHDTKTSPGRSNRFSTSLSKRVREVHPRSLARFGYCRCRNGGMERDGFAGSKDEPGRHSAFADEEV